VKTFIKGHSPKLKDSSINTQIYTLQFELGVLRRRGELYLPTERGQTLLDSGEPIALSDWLLTQVLGPDHVIVNLRDHGPTTRSALVALLQAAYPRWTSTFAPSSCLNWLRHLRVLDMEDSNQVRLTDEGQDWAGMIEWVPEPFREDHADAVDDELISVAEAADAGHVAVDLPDETAIIAAIAEVGHFPPTLIAKLHAGLWSHRRRPSPC